MANAPLYRYGDSIPVKMPWKVAYDINIGDLLFLDSTDTVTPPDSSAALYPVKQAGDFSWSSAIADPTTAVTIAATAATNLGPGFTVAGAGYKVAYTLVTADGLESGPNTLSAAMNTNTDVITVTGVTVPAGCTGVRWYVTTDGGGASTLQLVIDDSNGYGRGVVIVGPPPSDAPAPPAASALTATLVTQAAFTKKFAGVSAQYYGGEAITSTSLAYGVKDGYIRGDAGGVFDFPCASATFNDGDLVGVAKASGNALNPQKVVGVSQQAAAIGRVVMGGGSLTTVRVALFSPATKFAVSHPTFRN